MMLLTTLVFDPLIFAGKVAHFGAGYVPVFLFLGFRPFVFFSLRSRFHIEHVF